MNLQVFQELKYRALAKLTQSEALAQGDLRKALPEILQLTADALQVERVNLWEMIPDQPNAIVRLGSYFRSSNLFDQTAETVVLAEVYMEALLRDRMVAISDTANSVYVQDMMESYIVPYRIGAMVDTLITDNEMPIGMICCEHVGLAREWEMEERLFLMSIANMVALAIGTRERRRALRKVAFNEVRLRSLIENTDNAIWMLDTELTLLTFNTQFVIVCERYYRKTPVEKMNILELAVSGKELDQWLVRYHKALAGESSRKVDDFIIGGKTYTFETTTFPVIENKKVIGVSNFSKNITHIARTQRTLEEKNDELTRINKEMDEFVYRTSHDLRSPLTSVLGLISVVEHEDDLAKVREMLGLMRRSVGRLDTSIQDILNLSVNSRTAIQSQPIDWERLVSDTWEDLSFAAGQLNIVCEAQNLLEKPFFSDPRRLSMILTNLLSNAIRYHRPDEATPFVRVVIVPLGNIVQISCEDNGQGIAPEYLERIFEMFFRANSSKSGSGLGLYIVSEALNKLGGQISVTSELSKGTTFVITLPSMEG